MKNLKTLLALLLVVAMCLTLLAACAKSSDSKTDAPSGTPSEETNDPAGDEEDDGEIVSITMSYYNLAGRDSDSIKPIEDAINQISEEKIGVHVNFEFWDGGSYATNIGLAMAGGEVIDLMQMIPAQACSFNTMYAAGQLMDIKPYLTQDYAAGMYALLENYLPAFTYNDGIYGVPAYRIYPSNQYCLMRGDILDELGLRDAALSMETWQDLEDIVYEVADKTDIYGYTGSWQAETLTNNSVLFKSMETMGPFSDNYVFDNAGDQLNIIYVDEDNKVHLSYEQPEWIAACKLAAKWYEDGVLYPDAIVNQESCDTALKNGMAFSCIEMSEIGVEVSKTNSIGYPIVCPKLAGGIVKTATLTYWGMAVPVIAEEPEAAVKFMNLLYTDKDVINLLCWGIEGENYVVNENGEAAYPEGVDAQSVSYHSFDWFLGSQMLILPWEGQGGDFREQAERENQNAQNSPLLGFTLDTTGMDNIIAGLTAGWGQYHDTLTGGLYTDSLQDEYVAAMNAAGAQDYVAQIQEQVDAWLAAK